MEPIVTGINHWWWLMLAWPNSYHCNGSSSGFPLTDGLITASLSLHLLDPFSGPSDLPAWGLFPFSFSISLPLAPLFPVRLTPQGSVDLTHFLAISSVWQPLFCSLRTLEELQPLIISAICNTNCSNIGATKHDGENSSTMGIDIKANTESKMLAVPWQLS